MADKPPKHRSRLVADTEVIDGVEAGDDPDVQVFDLNDNDPGERRPAPARRRPVGRIRLEEVRTTRWSSRDLQRSVPPALERSKQVTGSIEVEQTSVAQTSVAQTPVAQTSVAQTSVAQTSVEPQQRTRVATPSPRPVTTPAPAPAASMTEETGRFAGPRAASALIRTGQVRLEDPLESTPTNPTGSAFVEAFPTDPGVDQGYVAFEEEPRDQPQRPRLEAPLQIKVQTVERFSPDPQLRVITASSSEAAEQYRVLSLKLKEGRTIRRVVAVAAPTAKSAGPSLAANLAFALAEGRRTRIALIDADLRNGQLASLFDLTEGPGLAEQIRNHRRNPDQPWILLSLTSNLHFIPAGAAEKNPSSLLNSEVLGDLVAELRRSYDFIIVSTPPVTESADVNILQEHMDGAILAVRAGVTRKDSVAASIARLGTRKLIGAVLV